MRTLMAALVFIMALSASSYSKDIGLDSNNSISNRLADVAVTNGEFTPPRPWTLERCIEIALEKNPDVLAARWDVKTSEAQKDAATAAGLPNVNLSGAYNHYQDSQRLKQAGQNSEPGFYTNGIYSADIIASLPLYTGGRVTNEIRATQFQTISLQQRHARARDETLYNVSAVFFAILGQERIVESLEFSLTTVMEHRERVSDLIEAGKAARVDLLRTDVRISEIEQQLVKEKNTLSVLKRMLSTLLGLNYDDAESEIQGSLELSEVKTDLDGSLARAFAARPDYLSAKAAIESLGWKEAAARSRRLPTVSLQGIYGGKWGAGSSSIAGADSTDDTWRLGVMVEVPVLDSGRITSNVREQEARVNAALERLRKLELQIRLEVETAILNVTSARQRVTTAEKAISLADESLRIEREKYEFGKGTIIDVLDAQSALLEAQTGYYRALAEYKTAAAQLALATGGYEI